MYYYVYILINLSGKFKPTYVGYSKNLYKRLKLHNTSKGAKFTRGRSWKIIYKKRYNSKSDAMKNEHYLKKNKILRNKIKLEYIKYNSNK